MYQDKKNYWGRLTHQALSETSNGNPQLVFTFDVMGLVDSANPDGELLSCPTGEATIYRVITDKTIDYVMEDLKHLLSKSGKDAAVTSFSQFDPNQLKFIDLRDTETELYCKHEQYNGRTMERWSISSGKQTKPLDPANVRKLDALFGKQLKSLGNGAKAPAKRAVVTTDATEPASQQQEESAVDSSDIPF